MENKSEERLYYLDAVRSFLILSVVLTHCLQVYNSNKTWNIYFEHGSIISTFMIDFLSLLIMPTFFMLAGYFTVISFAHFSGVKFLLKRLSRLVLPLITIALTLNVLQAFLLVNFGWKEYTIETYFTQGHWVSHLWFLLNLIVYTIISYLFITNVKTKTKSVLFLISKFFEKQSIYMILLLLPLINFGLVVIFKYIQINLYGININQIIMYMPYYLFGIILSINKDFLNKFSNTSLLIDFIVIIVAYTLMKNCEARNEIEYKVVYYYSKALGTWYMASMSFGIFKNFFNYKSEFLYKISDSSYTIYLVHHILVIIIGMLWIKLDLNFIVGLPLLFIIVVVMSYSFHRKVVLNFNVLKFLINGKMVR